MRASSVALLGVTGSALAGHVDTSVECPFTIQAVGPVTGPIGQIEDGQLNINGAGSASFLLDHGVLKDAYGRGCIITWPQRQLQCDYGNPGEDGFDVTVDGKLRYGGSSDWWACPINDYGIWNVYTDPLPGQLKCTMIDVVTNVPCNYDSSDSESDSEDEQEHGHWDHQPPSEHPCHKCTDSENSQHCFHTCWKGASGYPPPTPSPVPTTIAPPCSCGECTPGDLACWATCYTTIPSPPPTPTSTSCVETKTWNYTWIPTPKPTEMIPTSTAWGCNQCQNKNCDTTCWNTVTKTTTTMATVTSYNPIPCQNCYSPNDCTSTCTVISTATSTTTVWSPCVEKCQGDWNCVNQCTQPTPVCKSGQCGNWLDYKGGSDEEWEYPPRPWNYDGYWPYPAPDHMHPQNYYGFWQNQKRAVEVEASESEDVEVSKENVSKEDVQSEAKASEKEDYGLKWVPQLDTSATALDFHEDPATWLKIKTIMTGSIGICSNTFGSATHMAYQTLKRLEWIDAQGFSSSNPPPEDEEDNDIFAQNFVLESKDLYSQTVSEHLNDEDSLTPREQAIANLIERRMSSENELAYGSNYDMFGNNREFAIQTARDQYRPYRKNSKNFMSLQSKYAKCCSRCDFDDDPTPCFNECAFNECSSSCRSRNCLKQCRASLPTPCVPNEKCGEYEYETAGAECKTCGYGKYPEYDYFVIV